MHVQKECANGKPIVNGGSLPIVELIVGSRQGMHDEVDRGHDVPEITSDLAVGRSFLQQNVHEISLHQQNATFSHVSEETSSYAFVNADTAFHTVNRTFPNASLCPTIGYDWFVRLSVAFAHLRHEATANSHSCYNKSKMNLDSC